MDEMLERLRKYTSKRVYEAAEQEAFSSLLSELTKLVPPLPVEPELQPAQTYSEKLAKKSTVSAIQGAILSGFDKCCAIRGFCSLASRVVAPYQSHTVATPETCRRVVWAFDQQKISELDFVAFGFVVFLGALADNEQTTTELDADQILEPVNAFTKQRQAQENALQNTTLTLKTEIGARRTLPTYQNVYLLLQAAETVDLVRKMELNPTEELVFENISQRAVQIAMQVFEQCDAELNERDKKLRTYWTPKDDDWEVQLLLLAVAGATVLNQVQIYIQKIREICTKKLEAENQAKQDQKQAAEILRQLQETAQKIAQNKTAKVYKKFADLSEADQYKVKFRATDSLYNYVLLKKQLGLDSSQRLFDDNDEFMETRALKDNQLALFLQQQQRLNDANASADTLLLGSKINEIATMGSYVPNAPTSKVQLVKAGISDTGQKVPAIMAMDITSYAKEIQKTFYFTMNQQIGSWTGMRRAVNVLLHARAIYGQKLFKIADFFEMVGYQEPDTQIDLEEPQKADAPRKKEIKIENELLRSQAEKQLELEETKRKMFKQLRNARYTRSKMRLVIDGCVLGRCHDLFCGFIRWLSMFSKQSYPDDDVQKQIIELRSYCNLVTLKMVNGGEDLNYVPYMRSFDSLFELFGASTTLKTFTADELVTVLYSFWVFPFNLDLFELVKLCLKRGVHCNPVLLQSLKEMLGDLYVYLDAEGEDLMLASALYDSE